MNTKVLRKLIINEWLAVQESNPKKLKGLLVDAYGETSRCCLGNCMLEVVTNPFIKEHFKIKVTPTFEEGMCKLYFNNTSCDLPPEVAEVLNIYPDGRFKENKVRDVNDFIETLTGYRSNYLSLIGLNDESWLDHKQIGVIIRKCFDEDWFEPYSPDEE